MKRIIYIDFTIVKWNILILFELLVINVNINGRFHWTDKIKRNTNAENSLSLFYSLIYGVGTTGNSEVWSWSKVVSFQ